MIKSDVIFEIIVLCNANYKKITVHSLTSILYTVIEYLILYFYTIKIFLIIICFLIYKW